MLNYTRCCNLNALQTLAHTACMLTVCVEDNLFNFCPSVKSLHTNACETNSRVSEVSEVHTVLVKKRLLCLHRMCTMTLDIH